MKALMLVALFFGLSACQTTVKNTSKSEAVSMNTTAAAARPVRQVSNTSGQLTDHLSIDACRVDIAPCPEADVILPSDETNLGLTVHSDRVDFGFAEGTACQIALDSTNVHQHTDRERSIVVSAMNKPMHCVYSCETGDTSDGCPQPTVQQVNFIYVGLRHVGRATLIEIGDKPVHYYRNKRFLVPRQ